MFDAGVQAWPEEAPFHTRVFVVTHQERDPWERPGGTTFHFVNDGIETVVDHARQAAGDRDVRIVGGGATILEYVNAGPNDEFSIVLGTRVVRLRNPPVRGRGRRPGSPGAGPRGVDAAGDRPDLRSPGAVSAATGFRATSPRGTPIHRPLTVPPGTSAVNDNPVPVRRERAPASHVRGAHAQVPRSGQVHAGRPQGPARRRSRQSIGSGPRRSQEPGRHHGVSLFRLRRHRCLWHLRSPRRRGRDGLVRGCQLGRRRRRDPCQAADSRTGRCGVQAHAR